MTFRRNYLSQFLIEVGGSMLLRNVSIRLQVCTVLQLNLNNHRHKILKIYAVFQNVYQFPNACFCVADQNI
jgi:hypothetical protein